MSAPRWSLVVVALLGFLGGVWAGCGDPPSHCDLAPDDCYFRCAGYWCRRGTEYCSYNSSELGGSACKPMPGCNPGEAACDCLLRNNQRCDGSGGGGGQRDCHERGNGEVQCCTGGCCGPC